MAGIKAQIGYRKKPRNYGGKPAIVADNQLKKDFDSPSPDHVWVTDITYIRTHEGWLYLAVVIDLYARRVVGWSMQSRMHMGLVLSALLMPVWRRKPISRVIVHSDQGSQFTRYEWQSFLKTHNLEAVINHAVTGKIDVRRFVVKDGQAAQCKRCPSPERPLLRLHALTALVHS